MKGAGLFLLLWPCLGTSLDVREDTLISQQPRKEPLFWQLLSGITNSVLGSKEPTTTSSVDLSPTIDTLLTEPLPPVETSLESSDRINRPTRPARPSRPVIPDSFRTPTTTTRTVKQDAVVVEAEDTNLCLLACTAGRPAASLASMGACVGALVVKAMPEEEGFEAMAEEVGFEFMEEDEGNSDMMDFLDPALICPVSYLDIST